MRMRGGPKSEEELFVHLEDEFEDLEIFSSQQLITFLKL